MPRTQTHIKKSHTNKTITQEKIKRVHWDISVEKGAHNSNVHHKWIYIYIDLNTHKKESIFHVDLGEAASGYSKLNIRLQSQPLSLIM